MNVTPIQPSAAPEGASRTLPVTATSLSSRVRRWFSKDEEGPSAVIALVLVLAGTGLVEFTAYLLTRFP